MCSMTSTTPAIAAYEELSQLIQPVHFHPARITTIDQLRELWQIDDAAYQDCSLPFKVFRGWWQRYPLGITIILSEQKIVASLGCWPITPEQFDAFITGQIKETDLLPVPLSQCERSPQDCWYFSGVVLRPEFRGSVKKNPLLRLLRAGVGHWVESSHIAFPAKLAALGEFVEGENLLSSFGFSKTRDKSQMPDGCNLYTQTLPSEKPVEKLLSSYGVW